MVDRRLLLAISLSSCLAAASPRPPATYDPSVPAPETVLGFEVGARAAHHRDVVRYVEVLAAATDTVSVERYGKTHEGRELLVVIITGEENQRRLGEIREATARLAAAGEVVEKEELDELFRTTPGVAFLAYSIHGGETSGSDAALRVMYELAAGTSEAAARLRRELVIIIDPMQNPDGRERILAMSDAFQGAVPNPDRTSLGHTGFWPGGRGNHYFFDLNRDGFALVHPESRARARLLRRWRPQLVMDAHEMGTDSTFLASPARAPFNPNLPSSTRGWWDRFFADEAAAFDEHGFSYYHGEWFEEFFPGRGRAITPYQGAIDILHEQASTDGQLIRKSHGGLFSYRDAVERQALSSFANLGTHAGQREQLLRAYRGVRQEAIERGQNGRIRAFYFAPRPEGDRALRLARRLRDLGIEVEILDAAGDLDAAHTFWQYDTTPVELPAGAFRVRLDRPDGLLARAILEPHTSTPPAFHAVERARLEQGKGTRIYDVTAWSLLLASGLDGFWRGDLDPLEWRRFDGALPAPPTQVPHTGEADFGWMFDGLPDRALLLANELVARGIVVRVGERPVTMGEKRFARGSFLVRREENRVGAREIVADLASRRRLEVHAMTTGKSTIGPDLGGGHWPLVREAKIGILAGAPMDSTSVGAAWNLLDAECGVRVSLIDVGRLGRTDLERYTTLVVPDVRGGGQALRRALGESTIETLEKWVKNGGTLVGIGGGAELIALEKTGLGTIRRRRDVLAEYPPPSYGLSAASVRRLEPVQATGLTSTKKEQEADPAGGSAETSNDWSPVLEIPGAGSPIVGPGARAVAGDSTPGWSRPTSAATGAKEKPKELARRDARLRRFMPSGAILRVQLNDEHWLGYGTDERLPVLVRGRRTFIARSPAETVARFVDPEDLHLGGLLWPEAAGRIARTAYLARERHGRGQVILFAFDPNFRGYFWGTERLFLNAVLLGPGLGARSTIPW